MSQKNETTVLVLALLLTAGIIAGGFWWFTQKSGIKINKLDNSPANNSSPAGDADISYPSPVGEQGNFSKDFASVPNVPTGRFLYGGSTSWAPIRLTIDSAIQAARPEFRLRYVEPTNAVPGSATGIRMLINSQLDFAQSSRSLQDSERQHAQAKGFQLAQIPVAIDGLAIAVNPSLNIPGLSIEQLRAIYTGKITNWQEVGGPNLAIKPFSRPVSDGGTVELFVQEILKNQEFASSVGFVSTTTQALRQIASNPGGIYYASAPEVVPQCTIKPLPLKGSSGRWVAPYQEPFVPLSQCPNKRNQLNSSAFQSKQYPITRNLFVVIKQNGQKEQQAGVAYANFLRSNQGQELIHQSGFVKIR